MDLKQYVSEVEDWPKPVSFKDTQRLWIMVKHMDMRLTKSLNMREKEVDVVVGPEARGFIIGCPVAYSMGIDLFLFVKKVSYLEKLSVTNIV